MRRNWMMRGLGIALLIAAGLSLFSFFVMELWNWLVPSIFGWRTISFWQALGLFALSKLLFGGFRGVPGRRMRRRGMRERWEKMTPEQREHLRRGLMSCCFRGDARANRTAPTGAAEAQQ